MYYARSLVVLLIVAAAFASALAQEPAPVSQVEQQFRLYGCPLESVLNCQHDGPDR